MILQPYVENAIWHGLMHRKTQGQLTIEIKSQGEDIACIIEDDGIGRVAASRYKEKSIRKYKSMGMGITKDRIDIMNRINSAGISTKVEDLYDGQEASGTRVTLIIPARKMENFV